MRTLWTDGALAFWAAGLASSFVLLAYRIVGRWGLPLDDGWIHLQFARSLAGGDGLSFEAGRLISGSTAPLWTALVALLVGLPGSAVIWVLLLGTGLSVVSVLLLRRLACDLGLDRSLAAFAAFLMASTGPLVWAAVSGLEIPLFVCLSLVATRCHLRDRQQTGGIALSLPLFALSALARPEGLLLLALAVLDRALADRRLAAEPRWWGWLRGSWPGLLLAAAVLAPVALFNVAVSGSLLPTTFGAKSGGVVSLVPSLRYLHTVLGILFRAQPYMVLIAGAGALVLIRRLRREDNRGLLPALWLVALPLAYSCLASSGRPLVGNFGRYHYPLFPFVILLGCLGLAELRRSVAARSSRRAAALALALALFVAWPTLSHLRTTAGQYANSVRNVEDGDGRAARWLRDQLPAGATLAVNDIGLVQYLLPRHRLFDLAGIITPEVHQFTAAARARGLPWEAGIADYLAVSRPDYLVVFPSWFPGLLGTEVSFTPIREFVIDGNIALGGDRIVVYTTPWTRQELRP